DPAAAASATVTATHDSIHHSRPCTTGSRDRAATSTATPTTTVTAPDVRRASGTVHRPDGLGGVPLHDLPAERAVDVGRPPRDDGDEAERPGRQSGQAGHVGHAA